MSNGKSCLKHDSEHNYNLIILKLIPYLSVSTLSHNKCEIAILVHGTKCCSFTITAQKCCYKFFYQWFSYKDVLMSPCMIYFTNSALLYWPNTSNKKEWSEVLVCWFQWRKAHIKTFSSQCFRLSFNFSILIFHFALTLKRLGLGFDTWLGNGNYFDGSPSLICHLLSF